MVPMSFIINNHFSLTCFRGVDCVTDGDCGKGWYYFGQGICCDGKCKAVCAELVIEFPLKKFRVKIAGSYTTKKPQSRGFISF